MVENKNVLCGLLMVFEGEKRHQETADLDHQRSSDM